MVGRTEVERRERYISLLESGPLNSDHPDLVQLIKQCLHNNPQERPTASDLLNTLQRMKREVEGEYGGPVRLDMARVRLAKEARRKDRRIEELTRRTEELTQRNEDLVQRHVCVHVSSLLVLYITTMQKAERALIRMLNF